MVTYYLWGVFMKNKSFHLLVLAGIVSFFVSGCGGIGVEKISKEQWLNDRMTSALNSSSLSWKTVNILERTGYYDLYEQNVPDAISKLKILFDRTKNVSYAAALAEMCYLQGKEGGDIKYYMSSILFAYQYLGLAEKPVNGFSLQEYFITRYLNFSLTELFNFLKDRKIILNSEYQIPSVYGDIVFKKPDLIKAINVLGIEHFLPVYKLRVCGSKSNAYKTGLGVPLAGELNYVQEVSKGEDVILHPVTLMISVNFENGVPKTARLKFFDSMKTKIVPVMDKKFPLEMDLTTTLAEALVEPPLIKGIEFMIYPNEIRKDGGLYLSFEYDPDKIPVVLVHGLMSNPRTWARAFNLLMSDPRIRDHYQFWFFAYATGDPVVYSAANLRKALVKMQKKYAAESKDFNKMIIISHSMGGIVSSLLVKDSGNLLLDNNLLGVPVDKLELTPEQKNFLIDMLVFKRLPFIQRVVFISCPHRGSDLAAYYVVTEFCKYIVLPTRLSSLTYNVCKKLLIKAKLKKNDDPVFMTTGVNNLDPSNKTLALIEKMPYNRNVKYHTISGDYFDPTPLPGSSDGIVPYWSSHLNNVESEKVVTSGHSVQDTNAGIKEIQRILLDNLALNQ